MKDKTEAPIPLRVKCASPIITEEGDLIVAGTLGTVLRWGYDSQGCRTEWVWVAWDHYLFLDEPGKDVNVEQANTHKGLEAETTFDNLDWSDR